MEYARAAPDLGANRRFLGDYRDDQEQYEALMDFGLTFACCRRPKFDSRGCGQ
jgi:DNA-directed RNA polymerase subunit N (RpoN/RPB10)